MNERIEIRPGRTVDILAVGDPSADTTILLLHGLGGRKEQWQEQYHSLMKKYRVIVPDLLGHGSSDKPKSDHTNLYSFQELDQDIKAIFHRYAGKQNIVVGHSYGGALATSLTLAHPDKIQKLVLVSPAPLEPNTKIPFLFTLPVWVMECIRFILERQMAKLIFDPSADPKLVEQEIIITRQNPMHVIKSLINGFLTMPKADISHLNVPTTIIVGEHDKLIPPAVSLQFYEKLPDHHTVILKNVSHMANMEVPEKVTEMIAGRQAH